jgi:CheY-like chemotaxis protein
LLASFGALETPPPAARPRNGWGAQRKGRRKVLDVVTHKPNWDKICVMVIDDNTFMRNLLVNTIKSFGIENTVAEPDCATAIKRLKMSKTDPIAAGIGTVDMIISDYLMDGVDGNLFLHWIRTNQDVPDRFVPFVMVSGAADQFVVEQARDTGVNEFLAKPFSARSVADRILAVVNSPRQYVLAPGYFGPDRRRVALKVGDERRKTRKSEIQIVTPDSKIRTLREDVDAIYFRANNRLREKLGPGAREPVHFDPLIIDAAQARIQRLVGDYADWVKRYVLSMANSLSALEIGGWPEDGNAKHIANINRIAHELRGQSGTFDYQLITSFAKSLYLATMDSEMKITEDRVKLVGAHIDAIRNVFRNRITGDGGQVGKALLREIKNATQKYK